MQFVLLDPSSDLTTKLTNPATISILSSTMENDFTTIPETEAIHLNIRVGDKIEDLFHPNGSSLNPLNQTTEEPKISTPHILQFSSESSISTSSAENSSEHPDVFSSTDEPKGNN